MGVAAGPAARGEACQRDDLHLAAQLRCAARRQLLHFRAMAKLGKRVLSRIPGLCRRRPPAHSRRHARSPRSALRPRMPLRLRLCSGAHAVGSGDAGDRRQPGGQRQARRSGIGLYDRLDGVRRGRRGPRGNGRSIRDSRPAGRSAVSGVRLHGLSRRVACRRQRCRHRRDDGSVRRPQLSWRHSANHPGRAVFTDQFADGGDSVHRARAARGRGAR
jgi:hypothetical protein